LEYASTSATDDYYDISTLQGFCSQMGNYDSAAYMDTSIYVLNLAAVATTTGDVVGGDGGSVPTATGATPSSSGVKKGVGIMVSFYLRDRF
jgi:hypothetical protein